MYKMPSLGLMLLEVVSREESFTFTFEVTLFMHSIYCAVQRKGDDVKNKF